MDGVRPPVKTATHGRVAGPARQRRTDPDLRNQCDNTLRVGSDCNLEPTQCVYMTQEPRLWCANATAALSLTVCLPPETASWRRSQACWSAAVHAVVMSMVSVKLVRECAGDIMRLLFGAPRPVNLYNDPMADIHEFATHGFQRGRLRA